MGSACEVEYQLLLALDLKILTEAQCQPLSEMVVDVKRMLSGLTRYRMADGGRRKA